MSGFEVAGVILGAFPIVLSALQSYDEMSRRFNFWFEIRREHRKCCRRLKFQELRYTGTLKRLLLPLVADDVQLAVLMGDPGGPLWKDVALAEQLEARLQEDSYHLYLEIMIEMQQAINGLEAELSISSAPTTDRVHFGKLDSAFPPSPLSTVDKGDSTSPRNTVGRFKSFLKQKLKLKGRLDLGSEKRDYYWYRAKFAFGESKRNRFLEELQNCNDELEKLLQRGDDIQALRTVGSKHESVRGVLESVAHDFTCNFWSQASLLYKALAESWGCQCQHQHFARLILQHRTSTEQDFDLLVSYGSTRSTGTKNESGAWQHSRLEIRGKVIEQNHKMEVRIEGQTRPPAFPQHRLVTPTKSSLKGSHTSQSSTAKGITGTRTPEIVVTIVPPSTATEEHISPTSDEVHIPSLCSRLSNLRALGSQCAGFLKGSGTRYYVYPKEPTLTGATPLYTTLADLLTQKKPTDFSRTVRYQLALILASSFVQLKGTPWMPTKLFKKAVEFSQESTGAALQLTVPSLACGFAYPAAPETQSDGPDVEAIRTVGILILELCFGKAIEEHPLRQGQKWEDKNIAAALNLAAAVTWLGDVQGEAGSDYAAAVSWCLTGCGAIATRPWRQEMLRNVVAPLERCYQCLM